MKSEAIGQAAERHLKQSRIRAGFLYAKLACPCDGFPDDKKLMLKFLSFLLKLW
jgi:hypothetical protein